MKPDSAPASFGAVNPLRVLQVGLGPHGRNWARRVVPDLKEVELVAYVDSDPRALDLLRLILNREPQRIYCEAWNPEWAAFGGPSVAVASIVFEGGVVVSYRGSWVSAGPITPWAGEWRLEFENGEVFWTGREDEGVLQDKVVVRPRQGKARSVTLPMMRWTGGWATLAEFADAVQTHREPDSSGRNNLGSIALMAAAVESATQREVVAISRSGEALAI